MPHPVDVHVGSRLRDQRRLAGMSQVTLAEKLGVSYQQVQKYETGANRISASRLYELAKLLGVPVSDFFEGIPKSTSKGVKASEAEHQTMTRQDAALLRDFQTIEGNEVRTAIRNLAKLAANAR